jgi:hypothetical protein
MPIRRSATGRVKVKGRSVWCALSSNKIIAMVQK